ncbi:uncharacterized protein BX664DRAFT_337763 [Halteromyces radiatus]|uniref:uncharacterized protein n=1 Tax=Halteromyces radiatus TaxID=101107 RepID=UPI00221F77C9|nr:uncharacterized protein BX664DRAFT_337763 [Halteromyces radiatus]KAI8084777.1 hypothetical protein BX664DRAFT_337763 [Halteromyces radiatus]
MSTLSSPTTPTSPTPNLFNIAPPPWHALLKKSYNKNFLYMDDPVFISMSNIKRSGEISMHCLQFQSFIEDDARFLIFHIALNDNLMGDIKSDPNARLCWTMPKSKEYYKFSGKFYIASSPLQVTRFPPPKPIKSQLSAAEFWEKERKQQWKSLSDKVRATYTWPSRGDCPRAGTASFSCQSLKYFDEQTGNNKLDSNDKLKIVHSIAMDNYCLLVFKVTEVEYFDYNGYPPRRNLFCFSMKDNMWSTVELNP